MGVSNLYDVCFGVGASFNHAWILMASVRAIYLAARRKSRIWEIDILRVDEAFQKLQRWIA